MQRQPILARPRSDEQISPVSQSTSTRIGIGGAAPKLRTNARGHMGEPRSASREAKTPPSIAPLRQGGDSPTRSRLQPRRSAATLEPQLCGVPTKSRRCQNPAVDLQVGAPRRKVAESTIPTSSERACTQEPPASSVSAPSAPMATHRVEDNHMDQTSVPRRAHHQTSWINVDLEPNHDSTPKVPLAVAPAVKIRKSRHLIVRPNVKAPFGDRGGLPTLLEKAVSDPRLCKTTVHDVPRQGKGSSR